MHLHELRGWSPLNGRPGLRMAVRSQVKVLYARSVCDVQRRCSCSCRF